MSGARSLRSRVAVASALGATVVVLLVATLAWVVLSHNEYTQLDRRLTAIAQVADPAAAAPESYLVVVRRAGKVTGGAGSLLPVSAPGVVNRTIDGRAFRVLTTAPPRRPQVLVSVGAPLETTRAAVAELRRWILVVSGLAIAVAAGLGWLFAGRAVRPLRLLAAQARGVGDAPTTVQAAGAQETEELAGEINEMLQRLHSSQERTTAALRTAQDFAASAQHELRTPLTAMRTDLEVLRMPAALPEDERAQVINDLLRAHTRILDTLTALGQLAAGELADPGAMTELDVTELLYRVAAEAAHSNSGISVTVVPGPPVVVRVSPAGIVLAVDNLVRNAVRHGGASQVVLAVVWTCGGVEITVDDDGRGMPATELTRVFDRFTRGSNAVGTGSGLGLALVAQQAALHRGSARLERSQLGGMRAVLTLSVAG